ncbi:T9SS type A sorting domain-containing protein [Aestuariibaculum sp. M13]|uniref:T9SS type A sorting domain-containing protein n=1 Tax=Aestuariibaculum sp. M13 TaxID=2967132 RepID=UPI002159C558|nr:T9SS type A sorting domain-containing protein [Aestuariibaculum sp. M13]MCR8668975.1 T9SS type A sorting domain-containing protein [Aestuariibaculum sp. M13]
MKKQLHYYQITSKQVPLLIMLMLCSLSILHAQSKISGTLIGFEETYNNCTSCGKDRAIDGDLNTWGSSAEGAGFIGYDYGETGIVLTNFKYAPDANHVNRMVNSELRASNDPNYLNNYVTLHTITSAPAIGILTDVAIGPGPSYRFIYWYSPSWGYASVSELEFHDSNGEATGDLIGHDGSWDGVNNLKTNAFDKNFNTVVDSPPSGISFIGYDFGEGMGAQLSSWKYAPRPNGNEYRMTKCEVRGSNGPDIFNDYTVLATLDWGEADGLGGTLTEQVISDTGLYRYVYWYPIRGDSFGEIAELEFWGNTATLSTQNSEIKNTYSLYPNPLNGKSFKVTLNGSSVGSKINIKIYSILGKEVFNQNFVPTSKTIEVNQNLNSGIYIVKVNDKATSKLIVK